MIFEGRNFFINASSQNDFSNKKPYVIMIVGVNGVGKIQL